MFRRDSQETKRASEQLIKELGVYPHKFFDLYIYSKEILNANSHSIIRIRYSVKTPC